MSHNMYTYAAFEGPEYAKADPAKIWEQLYARLGQQIASESNRALMQSLVDANQPITLKVEAKIVDEGNGAKTHEISLTLDHSWPQARGKCVVVHACAEGPLVTQFVGVLRQMLESGVTAAIIYREPNFGVWLTGEVPNE